MKRKLLLILSLVLISVMMFSMCACDKEPQTGEPGTEQPNTSVDVDVIQKYSFKETEAIENEVWDSNAVDNANKAELLSMYTVQTNCDGVFDIGAISTEKPEGDALYSEVYAFKAPYDGCYAFDLAYNIGGEKGVGDGVTLSVYADTELLYKRSLKDGVSEAEDVSVSGSLEEGEYLYIIADPNESADGDVFSMGSIYAERCIDYAVDNTSSWAFGKGYDNTVSGTTDSWSKDLTQGTNGWYLSCDEDSKPGIIPESLEENIAVPEQSGIFYGTISDYADKKALYWQASEEEEYTVIVDCNVGFMSATEDTMTISFWDAENKIAEKEFKDDSGSYSCSMKIALDKGECFTLLLEPSESGDDIYVDNLSVSILK